MTAIGWTFNKQLIVERVAARHSVASNQSFTGAISEGIFERDGTAAWTVPTETPSALAIARHGWPDARSAAILEASTVTRGRPSVFPLARAFRRPALTRSTIKLRSSSATAPRTVKTILPAGVDVSICSEKETNSIPSALNVSRARSK